MKLLLINANYDSKVVGGGQRSLAFLAEGLVSRGHHVRVLSSGPSDLRETVGGVEHVRLRHHNLYWPFDGVPRGGATRAAWHALDSYNPFSARVIGSEIDAFMPDLVHTNVMAGISASVWRSVARRGLPLVHTLRDYYVVCARSELFRGGRVCEGTCSDCALFTALPKRLSSQVHAVVGNSHAILGAHLVRGAFARTPLRRVVVNGYRPPERPTRPAPRVDRLRVGYLGRLDASKGVGWLLDAFESLPDDRFSLDLAGTGADEYVQTLRERYTSDRIRFLGFTKPGDVFRHIDVLVVPSLWPEPLPRTVFEAYAHGVPVLGAARGGIPEAIDAGVSGYVYDPEDPEAFRGMLLALERSPEALAQLQVGAAHKASEFSPERVVSEYLEVYRDAIAAARTDPTDRPGWVPTSEDRIEP